MLAKTHTFSVKIVCKTRFVNRFLFLYIHIHKKHYLNFKT